jgi:wobble nucleotide-excising tRNase
LGNPARNLSEGEKTAIAFLYFLKSLEDKDFTLTEGIVVIDDPVSSLDANSLYGAFGYLKEKTVNAKQLFILTHHFTLFREAKNWLKFLGKDHQKIAKYQIECEHGTNCRISRICALQKLLDEYDSEYYYLFHRVYWIGYNDNPAGSIEHYYGMPNVARRLVEAFFAFKRPAQLKGDSDKGLLEAIQKTQLDIAEKTKIYRFLNTFSHLRRIGDQEHDISILSETPAIMKSVLNMIELEDPGHFAEMKQVIGVRA